MKNKEFYIYPELEMINYDLDDIIHTSVIEIPGIYDEGEINIDTDDIFDDDIIDVDDDFFDD